LGGLRGGSPAKKGACNTLMLYNTLPGKPGKPQSKVLQGKARQAPRQYLARLQSGGKVL